MRLAATVRIGSMAACLAFVAMAASAQDLGSANKLFGGTKTASTPKKPVKKATTKVKPSSTAKKPASKKSASSAKSTTVKKPVVKAAQPKPENKAAATSERFVGPEKLTAADRDRYEDLIEDGNAARDDRNYSAAEAAYRKANSLNPRDYRAVYGLGNLYSDQQRWDEAEASYRAALKIEPSNAITHIALSYVYAQPISAPDLFDRYADAERLARRAIQLDPKNPLAFDQLGAAMELRGLIGPETENAYRRAIQMAPTFAPAYAHLGRLLRRRGLAKESAEAYKKAVSLSTDVATMILVAEVMQSEQRYSDSEPLLRSAVAGDPRNPAALVLLGRALTALGKYAEAEQTLRKSIAVVPNAYVPNSLLGSLFWRQGKYELAEGALMQAVRFVSPLEKRQLAQQFEALGDGYAKTGRTANAERAYRQATVLDAENRSVAAKLLKGRSD